MLIYADANTSNATRHIVPATRTVNHVPKSVDAESALIRRVCST